jgi:hypothetical protein
MSQGSRGDGRDGGVVISEIIGDWECQNPELNQHLQRA